LKVPPKKEKLLGLGYPGPWPGRKVGRNFWRLAKKGNSSINPRKLAPLKILFPLLKKKEGWIILPWIGGIKRAH